MGWDEAKYIIDQIMGKIRIERVSGIPPSNMITFAAYGENQKVKLRAEVPKDTIIDGQTICSCVGVKIIRKISSAPISPEDGTLVANLKAGAVYNAYDENLVNGVTYYYGFFPYSDHGVYNFNKVNILKAVPSPVKYWAFNQNFSDKNPATTITYPTGFQNSSFTPMMTCEGNGTVTVGSWSSFLKTVLRNYPAMVKKTGEMDYQLDAANYTLKKMGGNSDYQNLNYNGGAFAWLNRIYMKETYAANGLSREVQFADAWADGFLPVGFYDRDGTVLEGIWLPMGYMNADGKTLIAGTTAVFGKTTMDEEHIIRNWSPRAVFMGGPIMHVLRDLEYMLFKSTDIQAKAGNGQCYLSTSEVHLANENVPNGAVEGWKGTNTKNKRNKYFHSQVLGSYDRWQRDPYTVLVNGRLKMSYNYNYDITGASYIDTGRTWGAGGWYYPSTLETLSDKRLGSEMKWENTGSTSTGLCDGQCGDASGTRVAVRLGNTSSDLNGGPGTLYLNGGAGVAAWDFGASVILLPPAGYAPTVS